MSLMFKAGFTKLCQQELTSATDKTRFSRTWKMVQSCRNGRSRSHFSYSYPQVVIRMLMSGRL